MWCPGQRAFHQAGVGLAVKAVSRVTGESCGWNHAGGKRGPWGWKVEDSATGDPPQSLSISAESLEAQSGICHPASNRTVLALPFGELCLPPRMVAKAL